MAEPPTAVLILALDTTTRAGSAAVLRDRDVLALVHGDARTHGERLPAELAQALDISGVALEDIDLLAVAVGPGAFTGLRIGIAAVQGLALTMGRPVAGISALDALAAAAAADTSAPGRLGAWIDASRGEVYAALYDTAQAADGEPSVRQLDPPSVGPPPVILARWDEAFGPAVTTVIGDGAVRYQPTLAESGRRAVPPPDLAGWIGRLAIDAFSRGLAGPPHALRPLYVRRPDVEMLRDRTGS